MEPGTVYGSNFCMEAFYADHEAEEKVQAYANFTSESRLAHLEMFAAAYLQRTHLDPRDVELVEVRDGSTTSWFFKPRD